MTNVLFLIQTLLVTVSDSGTAPVNLTGGPLQYTYRLKEITNICL